MDCCGLWLKPNLFQSYIQKEFSKIVWAYTFQILNPQPVTLRTMVAPGAGFRGGTLFRSKTSWRTNKKKFFAAKLVGFWSNWGWGPNKVKKERYSPQIGGVMVSHIITICWCQPKMWHPGWAVPPLATPQPPPLQLKMRFLSGMAIALHQWLSAIFVTQEIEMWCRIEEYCTCNLFAIIKKFSMW